jgi:7,8-dihydropterin-6-yl-methyl-4-(beta-D-ribofuranosyl)aminobenzene 5'-phosphate synthase
VGNVPAVEGFTPTENFFIKVGNQLFPDQMEHEQTLVIEDENGLHVFSGCSHMGIIPILRYIQEKIPGKKIDSVVAGMHLYSASNELIDSIIEEMRAMGIRHIFPVHCTGMNAIIRFKMKMGDAAKIAAAGDTFEI